MMILGAFLTASSIFLPKVVNAESRASKGRDYATWRLLSSFSNGNFSFNYGSVSSWFAITSS